MNVRNFIDLKSLLLENKTIRQTIFKNTFWLAVAEGISRFLKFILIVYVARILGATEYGKFTFALSFVSLFVIFSDFGLSSIITREFSRKREKEKEFLSIFTLKTLLSLGVLVLILIGSLFVTHEPAIRWMIWILAVYVLTYRFPEIIYAFLRARQKMEYESWIKILQAVLLIGTGFFVIFNFPSVQNLSYVYLFVASTILIFALTFFHFKIYHLGLGWNKSVWKRFLAMSWPLALVGLFAVICGHTDSIMMGYWGQIIEVGWYNAAYKIIGATLIPSTIIFQGFYPIMSIAFRESKERLQKVWDYRMGIIILIAIPLVVGGLVLAPKIINFIYNPSYISSILVFQILIVMTGIIYFISPLSQILIVSNQQEKNFWIVGSGAIVNIFLNLILIPRYSLYGAAVATLITTFLMFILYLVSVIRFTPINPLNINFFLFLFSTILSSIPMYFVISHPLVYNINVLLTVSIGTAIYLIFLFVFNKIFRLNLIKL